jgi:AcrR family transcriptional regulator
VSTSPADGRRLRSERSRQAVIDALLSLYEQGIIRPSVAQIAEASGVSERSVFRHFTDLEDLASAATTRQIGQVMEYFADPAPSDTTAERVASLVDQRMVLHRRVGNMARAAVHHAVTSPTIAQTVADRRKLLHAQIARHLAVELDAQVEPTRTRTLAALDQLLSLEALDHFRSGPAPLCDEDLRQLLIDTTTALLSAAHEEAR